LRGSTRLAAPTEVIEETVELNLDTAESQLMSLIANGNLRAVIFYLKTKGKARGYVERVEATGSGGGPIKIDIETVRNARQRNLELVHKTAPFCPVAAPSHRARRPRSARPARCSERRCS